MKHHNCVGWISGCENCTERRVRESIAEAVRARGHALRGLAAWKCDAFQALADDIASGECRADEVYEPEADAPSESAARRDT